ncbi:MAG: complex I subunit 5 family protein [Clostridiales bacterium]|nr:complex I subunit 5 family protein [Clostridiales bacterium]
MRVAQSLIAAAVFWPMLAAAAGYAIGKKSRRARDAFVFCACVIALLLSMSLSLWHSDAKLGLVGIGGVQLQFMLDGFRTILVCAAVFLWIVTTLFSPEYFSGKQSPERYWLFNMMTLGAVTGFFYSADFFTAFIFFEITSLTSYTMVAHEGNPVALRAAETYLAVAIIGGLSILMGMLLLWQRMGTLAFALLYDACTAMPDKSALYLPGSLMLVGFGAKAGLFPLHIWLPKAHPVAPAPASALLSGILTKTGVFGVALVSCYLFPADEKWSVTLLAFAAITMLLGAVLAVFSNDLKRTLACSSVSQIGFIVIGVAMQGLLGDHNGIAVRGTVLHIVNHSLVKLVLFIAAGVIYRNRHELALDKLRGYGRGKPLLCFVFLMGALALGGLPFWSGYISKTLLHESIVEGIHIFAGFPLAIFLHALEIAFIVTGGLTVAYMLRLCITLFVEKGDAEEKSKPYVSRRSAVTLVITATLLPFFGILTGLTDTLADSGSGFFNGYAVYQAVAYFAWVNLKGVIISFAIGIAVYILIIRGLLIRHRNDGAIIRIVEWPGWLDMEDLLYRPLLRGLVLSAADLVRIVSSLPDMLARGLISSATLLASAASLPDRSAQAILHYSHPPEKEPNITNRFSVGLILVGLGICASLIYVLIHAL